MKKLGVGVLLAMSCFVAVPAARAEQLKLNVALANPTMYVPSDKPVSIKGEGPNNDGEVLTPKKFGENHLRIALKGFELPKSKDRIPVNVAIVIDQSGSMQGHKIDHARQAALSAIQMLRDSDIVSIIAYADKADVLVPATKASDREMLKQKISSIHADGSTALFAGVTQGAAEVRKFMDKNRVNRVILLSDGQANVGPSSTPELEDLGRTLIKEGISVSTFGLGLGYNEDLMSRLAIASTGNHAFVEDAELLTTVFQSEFRDAQSVVAQNVKINATFAEGIRPVKALGHEAEIVGQTLQLQLGQIYEGQERYVVVEVEVPYGANDSSREVASVTAEYRNMNTETIDRLSSQVQVRFTNSKEVAEKSIDKSVLAACVLQIANERNRQATTLRDEGKISEAKVLLQLNCDYLEDNYRLTEERGLLERSKDNAQQAGEVDSESWNLSRKRMRSLQLNDRAQGRYSAPLKK